MVLGEVLAGQTGDLEPGGGVALLTANGLAAAGRQRAEKIVEGRIAAVQPVVLLVLTSQESLLG